MTSRSNIHSHCTFCDGKNTIDEMVQAAIESKLLSIGFSSHAHTGYSFDDCQVNDLDGYFAEIEAARVRYQGRITIFQGLELESLIPGPDGKDIFPTIDPRCQYTIGSCHYARAKGNYYSIDYKPEMLDDAIEAFNGVENFINDYYTSYLSFAKAVPFDIIGHIDLYTKFNEKHPILDENSEKYRKQVLPYIDELISLNRIFEVNTGAMSRGYRSTPYPAAFILRHLLERKAPIIITSDTHSRNTICYAFDETEAMLREIGFKEQMQLTEDGFVAVPL